MEHEDGEERFGTRESSWPENLPGLQSQEKVQDGGEVQEMVRPYPAVFEQMRWRLVPLSEDRIEMREKTLEK